MWAYPVSKVPDSPRLQWWGVVVVKALIGLLMVWRLANFRTISPGMWLNIPLIVVVLLGVRYLGMNLMARHQKLAVRLIQIEHLPLACNPGLLSLG